MDEQRYLGDGVYAIWDGFGVWLHANHHENPTDRVYLESCTLAQLNRFRDDMLAQARGQQETQDD